MRGIKLHGMAYMHTSTSTVASVIAMLALLITSIGVNASCYRSDNNCSGSNSRYEADSTSSSGITNQAKVEAATSALQAIGTLLQQREDQQQAEQQQLEQNRLNTERQQQQQQDAMTRKNFQTMDSFESSMENDDWQSRAKTVSSNKGTAASKTPAQTSSSGECNCREEAGICNATVVVVKKRPTGADFKVTSSAPRCSKVSYYIDSTPRLTVLNNTNSAMEHAAGLTQITNKTFEVESCKVCASK